MQPSSAGHPYRWRILLVLVGSMIMMLVDNTILNVALKTIADPTVGLGASQAELEWIVNAYTLIFSALLFTWGVLADRHGRQRILLIGLITFGLSSLIATFVRTPGALILMRTIMGFGSAAVMPATLAIIAAVFSHEERPRAIGLWSGSVGVGLALGPMMGGVLLEHFHWSSIFFVNVPIAVVSAVAVWLVVPESKNPNPGALDPVGVLLSIVGLTSLCFGLIRGGEYGFGDLIALATTIAGIAVLVGFVVFERGVANPALDVKLFRDPRFSAAIANIGLTFFTLMGLTFFMAFYMQSILELTPLQAGATMIPLAVAQMIAAPLSPRLVERFGVRNVCTAGTLLFAASMAGITLYDIDTPIILPILNMTILGFAMGTVMAPATSSVMAAVPREKMGAGSAVSAAIRQIGAVFGVAIIGSLTALAYRSSLAPAIAGLAEPLQATVSGSVQATLAFAGATSNPALALTAKHAYIAAMHEGALFGAATSLFAAFIAWRWFPAHLAQQAPMGGPVPAPARPQ